MSSNPQKFSVVAPTRVDLAGGTLDLWPLYCMTEGASTINLAIEVFAKVQVAFSESKDLKISIEHPDVGSLLISPALSRQEVFKLPPSVRFSAYLISRYLGMKEPGRLVHATLSWTTEAPIGSGLGGSSTLAVALTRALAELFQDFTEQGWQWKMMGWARDLEAAYLAVPTGTQDYLAALFGGLSRFDSLFGEMRRSTYRPEVVQELSDRLVVIFSGEQHHSGKSNWEVYQAAMAGDRAVIEGLLRLVAITQAMDTELQRASVPWASVGKLMSEEWKVRREVFRVNTPKLDQLIGFLQQQNIWGVKVCGAAAGGSLIALMPEDKVAALKKMGPSHGLKFLSSNVSTKGVHCIR